MYIRILFVGIRITLILRLLMYQRNRTLTYDDIILWSFYICLKPTERKKVSEKLLSFCLIKLKSFQPGMKRYIFIARIQQLPRPRKPQSNAKFLFIINLIVLTTLSGPFKLIGNITCVLNSGFSWLIWMVNSSIRYQGCSRYFTLTVLDFFYIFIS